MGTGRHQPHGDSPCRPFLPPLKAERTLSRLSGTEFCIHPLNRGKIKQALIKIGYPAEDLAGYTQGAPVRFSVRDTTRVGAKFRFRPYQQQAADTFYAGGSERGGAGVIVLPCGAGKTIVGISCMQKLQTSTLILTTGVTAIRQWKAELLDKTDLIAEEIGEYSGADKTIRPITIDALDWLAQLSTHKGPQQGFERIIDSIASVQAWRW